MVSIQQIICPTDFSEPSLHALKHAAAAARWYGAQVTVVHVYSMPIAWSAAAGAPAAVPVLPPIEPQEVVSEVRRFSAQVLDDRSPEVVVVEGNAAKEIARVADERQADLLVMGTHGRGGFERLFLGSVTEKVVRTAPCPVLTVPPPVQRPMTDPVIYKTILCPLDFSEVSHQALQYAFSLSERTGACVTPLHVVEGFIEEPALDFRRHFNVPEYRRYMEEDARTRLTAATAGVPAACKAEPRVVVGKAREQILRVADDLQADLIVMGVRGSGAADRFGSTTHRIVQEAPCPVLTWRPK